jgi:hypothetical protein
LLAAEALSAGPDPAVRNVRSDNGISFIHDHKYIRYVSTGAELAPVPD